MKKAVWCVRILLSITFLCLFHTDIYASSILDDLPLSPMPLSGVYQPMANVSDGEKIIAFDVSEKMGKC